MKSQTDKQLITPQARAFASLCAPVVLAVFGVVWMYAAVAHYERITGREFYGLAAQHYSIPEWKMVYHPGGEAIERWTVNVPTTCTGVALVLLLLLAVVGEWRRRRAGWFVAYVLWYAFVAAAFLLISLWVSVNVTGVFV
jgi:hypothetical protein